VIDRPYPVTCPGTPQLREAVKAITKHGGYAVGPHRHRGPAHLAIADR
jgi:hypothetical protein